jgi:hypothetical protein
VTVIDMTTTSSYATRRFARRSRHGVALQAVALLGVAAATLSMLIVRQVIISSRANAYEQVAGDARAAAQEALDDVLSLLAADPTLPIRTVLDGEQPRRCVAALNDAALQAATPTHPIYPAGSSWPAACGTVWTHPLAEVGALALKVRSPDHRGELRIEALVTSGTVQAGRQVTLRTAEAGRYALWTAGDLDLERFVSGPASLSGGLYAAGDLLLPVRDEVVFEQVQLMAEKRIVGSLPELDGVRYYEADPDPVARPQVRELRGVVSTVGNAAQLRSAVSLSAEVACRAPAMVRFPASGELPVRSSQLCIRPGAVVPAMTSGASFTVPANARAVLLLPERSGANTIDVFTRTVPWARGSCLVACDLYGLAALDVAANAHPGTLTGWQPLGTVPMPTSGLVGTRNLQTHVGLCGPGFLDANTPCGVTAPIRPMTVVAGTLAQPQDLLVAGPVGNLGLVATRDLLIAYWSSPAAGSLPIDAHLVALGTVASAPQLRSSQPVNSTGGTLQLSGSLLASSWEPFGGWQQVIVAPSGAAPTPWLPGPRASLDPQQASNLTPFEACGERFCTQW